MIQTQTYTQFTQESCFERCEHNHENPYVQISRAMFRDKSISPKAKGILGYLLSLPSNWKIYHSQLQDALAVGEDYINSGMEELINAGYAERTRERIKGVFQPYKYKIREVKKCLPEGKTQAGFSSPENPDIQNIYTQNKDIQNKQQQAAPDAAVFSSEKEKQHFHKLSDQNNQTSTDSSNLEISKKKQHNIKNETCPTSTPPFPLKNSPISKKNYPILENVNIPERDKIEITNRYEESVVENAIEWANHQIEFKKGLAAALKFACSNKLKWEGEKPKKTIYEMLCEKFKDGQYYFGAECTLNKNVIAFRRGVKYFEMKLDKYFSWQKFKELGESLRGGLAQAC